MCGVSAFDTPTRLSPDGRIEVTFSAYEIGRMSHWVYEPRVVRTRDRRTIVDLDNTSWDSMLHAEFPAPDRVAFDLRRYPDGSHFVRVVIDVEAELCGFWDEEPLRRPLSRLVPGLHRERKALKGRLQAGG